MQQSVRKSLKDVLADFQSMDARTFATRYNTASLLGVGKATNVVEEDSGKGGANTRVINIIQSADAAQESAPQTSESRASQPPIEWTIEQSGNSNILWSIPYSPTPLRLGRRQDNHIIIAEQSISALHCNFRWNSLTSVSITDSGASNGVWIGTKRLSRGTAHELKGGELILLGRFQFHFFTAAGLLTWLRGHTGAKG